MTPAVEAPEIDFLDALEAKIHEASERLRALRGENRALAQKVADLEAQLAERGEDAAVIDMTGAASEPNEEWRQERDAIRRRVESLAGRLDELLGEGEEE
ncbi:MAG TPA: cell division protein ZapB [Thermoanaerobaculia bacterium]|jgi:FtsZ-binding cell division protein ZapB|nr:cell division protein ZapB [Thermoanaerobaculia bacterium]